MPQEVVAEEEGKELETPAVEEAEDNPSVKALADLTDDELCEVLGLDKMLADAKKAIKELEGMTGKSREYAEERIVRMFTPNIYPNDFKYLVEDAKRAGRTGKDALNDCGPASVL